MTTSQIAVASTVAPSTSTKAARKPRVAKAAAPKTSKPRAEKKVAAPKAPRAPRKVKAVASPVVEQVVVTETLTFEPEPAPVAETAPVAQEPKPAKAPRTKKEKAPSKAYPFITRNQVLSLLATDDDAVLQSLQSLDARQTETEQERAQTISRNRSGWTLSHAPKGTALAKKAREVGLTAEEVSEARSLVSHYSKQLCRQMRDEEIAKNPALAETARLFSC